MSHYKFYSHVKTKMIRSSSFFLFLILSILVGCDSTSLNMVSVHGNTMGTTYNIKVVAVQSELPTSQDLNSWADTTFVAINQSMSTYIPNSELSLLNVSSNDQWQSVSGDLFYVLSLSQKISELSEGAFDITVGAVVDLWGFGPKAQQEHVPSQEQIDQVKAQMGYHQLELDPVEHKVKKPVGLTIDLSAVAKGFAVDAMAKILRSKGYTNFMVEVGGELALSGVNPQEKTWTIGIESPSYNPVVDKHSAPRAVSISGKGMATSGDYRNYYEEDGVRYSHTIDPATGRPITHSLASVTVITNDCAEADALATALNVMGPEKAMALAEKVGLAVYLIVRNGDKFDVQYSSAFKNYLVEKKG